jgi:gliding motility-associated-like protein
MLFYEGELYMAAMQGMVRVDRATPSNSSIAIPWSASLSIFGLVSVPTLLRKNTVYGLSLDGGGQTNIVELDIENNTVLGVVGTLPFIVWDAASVVEGGSIQGIVIDSVNVYQDCGAQPKGIIEVFTKPSVEELTYQLVNGMSNSTGLFTDVDAGTYQLTITSSNDSQTLPVTVPVYTFSPPVVQYSANHPSCTIKGDIQFAVTNSENYKIMYESVVYSADHLFTGLEAGKHKFSLLTQSGCELDQYEIDLTYESCTVQIDSIIITAECEVLSKGMVTVVSPTIPETYTYTLNGLSNSTGIFNMLDPGTYELTVSTSGRSEPLIRSVVVPKLTYDDPGMIVRRVDPGCEALGKISFSFGADASKIEIKYNLEKVPSNTSFENLLPGTYSFEIYKHGCIVAETEVILEQQKCSPVVFPSSFTPNQDGINDIFRPNPEGRANAFKMQIFNRWGNLLFVSTDIHQGWNGEHKGQMLPVGTYYWVADILTEDNKVTLQRGYVSLIR